MNIDEAIMDLASIPPWPNENDDAHYLDSIKLGIEALKVVVYTRLLHPRFFRDSLPGETKD